MCLVQKKGFPYYLGEAGEQIAKGHVEKKENCSPPKSYWENWGKFWGKKNKAGKLFNLFFNKMTQKKKKQTKSSKINCIWGLHLFQDKVDDSKLYSR